MAPRNAESKRLGKNRGRPAKGQTQNQTSLGNLHHVEESVGCYVFQFQDDKTGRKYVHPSAMRFALRIMDDEAQESTQSVLQSLKENGQLDESKKVQVRSSHHVKKIVANVRKRLRDIMIPARYVRIDDVILQELTTINLQRKEEIAENNQLIKKLELHFKSMQKEHDKARAKRDKLQEKILEGQATSAKSGVHPMLKEHAEHFRTSQVKMKNDNKNVIFGTKQPDDEALTMTKLLSQVTSPYDSIL